MQNRFEISGLADVHSQTRLQANAWTVISDLTASFAKRKLVEEGWLPKTTQSAIKLMSLDNQRDVTSLCTILLRRVLKSIPYVEHLTNYQTEKLIASRHGNMVVQGYVYSERAVLQMSRYLRYLNYILRKNKVPLWFSVIKSTSVDGLSMSKITFQCELAAFYPLSAADSVVTRVCLPEDALAARFQTIEERAKEAFGNPDAAYSHRGGDLSAWGIVPVHYACQAQYNALRSGRDTNYSVVIPEMVFLMLPQILKFVENLTRKLVYGPSAFAVVAKDDTLRNAESTVAVADSEQPASAA